MKSVEFPCNLSIMPDESNRHIEEESTYPEIKLPELKSDIPPHLLNEASEEAKYILEQLSVLSQYAKWSAPVVVEISTQTRKTNGRLIRVEKWKEMFTSWWALTAGFLAVAAAVIEIIHLLNGS